MNTSLGKVIKNRSSNCGEDSTIALHRPYAWCMFVKGISEQKKAALQFLYNLPMGWVA